MSKLWPPAEKQAQKLARELGREKAREVAKRKADDACFMAYTFAQSDRNFWLAVLKALY